MAGEPGGPQVPTPMLPDALWAQGMSAAQRAYQVLSLPPQMLPTTPSTGFVLRKRNLKFRQVNNLPRATQLGVGGDGAV